MLSGVKFLLYILWFTLHCTVRWELSLVDMSGYNHPVRLLDGNATQKIKRKKTT